MCHVRCVTFVIFFISHPISHISHLASLDAAFRKESKDNDSRS